MKKTLLTLSFIAMNAISFAQFTTTTVPLTDDSERTIKIDTDSSIVTLTITGPSTSWLGVGFNGFSMSEVTDMFIWNASSNRDYTPSGSRSMPSADAVQSWTIVSDTVSFGVRTVVATRSLISSGDYTFLNNSSSINIIYARGSSTTLAYHSTNPHSIQTLTRTALGVDNFSSKTIAIYPNPTTDKFTVQSEVLVDNIIVYDHIGKEVLKFEQAQNVYDISKLAKGIYLLEIKTNSDKKSFHKIVIE